MNNTGAVTTRGTVEAEQSAFFYYELAVSLWGKWEEMYGLKVIDLVSS